jgi:WD40 repeat protein/tRNA A-37 threonylcarbamoyl transferase component Bud32
MNTGRTCPNCGSALDTRALGGLCPTCVARVSMRQMFSPPTHELAGEPSHPAKPTPLIESFGDYEILEQTGAGGMGVVFKARQIKLQRLVALKMVRQGQFATEVERQRFQAEAEAAAQLDHPNIVPIYEVGEHLGRPFFSMRLIEGGTLADRLDKRAAGAADGNDSQSRLVQLMIKVARAVHYAHQHGILHRDLKPANILLDGDFEPFVTDFGLARRMENEGDLTLSGAVIGTPGYMSPEQASGQVRKLTTAADVFGLGAILYHALTGRAPFRADSFAEAVRKVIEEDPPRPSKVNTGVDRDLETICLKCLEKTPEHRYASAEALADDLEHWQRHEVIHARPSTSVERVVKWARRRPTVAALVGLVAVSVLAGIAGITWQWRKAVVERKRADLNAATTRDALNQAKDALWQSQFERARALRQTRLIGQRVKALEAIRAAAAIRRTSELRHEAIAALALPDLDQETQWQPLPAGTVRFVMEPALGYYAIANGTNRISVHRQSDGGELFFVEDRLLIEPELEFSEDGRFLVAFKEWMVRVWNATNGAMVLALDFPDRGIRLRNLTVSVDGRRLAYSDQANRVKIYDLETGALTVELGNLDRPWRCAFHPQGNLLGVECTREVQLWDLNERRMIKTTDVPANGVGVIAWNPDGRLMAIGLLDSRILVWDVQSNQTQTLIGHTREVFNLWFHSHDRTLLSTSWDNTVRLWEPVTGVQLLQTGGIIPRGFSRNGEKLIVWKQPGGFGTYAVQRPAICRLLATAPQSAPLLTVEFSGDSKLLLGANAAGLWLWRVDTGKQAATGNMPHCQFASFLSTDALLSCGRSGLHVWEVVRDAGGDAVSLGAPARSPVDPKVPLGFAALDFDRRHLAVHLTGTSRGVALDLEGPKPAIELLGPPDFAWPAFSPNGRWIAAGCWNPTVTKPMFATVWDASSGRVITNLPSTKCSVTFSPDNRWLLLGANTEYRLIETGFWKQARIFERGEAVVSNGHAAFSPDGSLLALQATDRVLRLVNPITGEEFARLTSPDNRILGTLAFSPDGRWLAAATEANVQLWDLAILRRELAALGLDW